MLTNAYYFKLYRPYIVGVKDRNDVTQRRSRITKPSPQEKIDQGMMVVLNKSLKNEIVNYAQNVSHGVTRFKTSVRTLLTDMGSFGLNSMYNGYDSALRQVEKDLERVAESYNKGTSYLEGQRQSSDLRNFSLELRDRIYQGQDRLSLLGLFVEGEGESLSFDRDFIRSLSHIELHAAIGANMQVFNSLHQSTSAVLTAPLSSHMHFRGLSYHYNYQLGRMVEDGFGIIESGMIVDRII